MVKERPLTGDQAAMGTSVVAFLVAGVLFVASVVAVLVATRDSAGQSAADPIDSARLDVQAASLANLLLHSPGFTSNGVEFGNGLGVVGYDGKISNADAVTRLGLLDPDANQPFMMDFGKFQNLRQAPFSSDPAVDCDGDAILDGDCYVNYEEARRQFGLEELGLDFHLRSYPNLRSYAEMLALGMRDQNLKVAYIADAEAAAAPVAIPYGHGLELQSPSGVANGHCVITNSLPANYAYVAGSLACSTVSGQTNPFACTATADGKGYRVATVVHNGGDGTTRFKGVFSLKFSATDTLSLTQYSLPVGNTGNADGLPDTSLLYVDFARTGTRTCSGLLATLELYDPDKKMLELQRTMAEPGTAPSTTTRGLVLKLTGGVWEDDDDIDFTYTGPGLAAGDNLILTICPTPLVAGEFQETECRLGSDTSGYIAWEYNVPPQESQRDFDVPDSEFGVGRYIARLYYNGDNDDDIETSEFRSSVRFTVLANANPNLDLDPYATPSLPPSVAGDYDTGSSVSVEVAFIESLMEKFCPYWYDSDEDSPMPSYDADTLPAPDPATHSHLARCGGWRNADWPATHEGDVYSTDGTELKKNLDERLYDTADCDPLADADEATTCNIDILVVGSEVDHEKLTNGQVKGAIEDWVYAGGTLIVFGSADQKTEWLQSIFHTALEGGEHGNGVTAPDEGHPILNVPNDLAWNVYEHAYSWRLKETGSFNAEEAFTRVVNEQGGTATDPPNTVLAVGDPGDFGLGNVIITGWTPWDLELDGAGSQSLLDEGRMFVHNLLMMGYNDLYLDYGPELPFQANVVPAVRNVQICHPSFDDEILTPAVCDDPIPMNMQVYVF